VKLRKAVDEFIAAKEIENLSERTLQVYRWMTEELVDFLGDISLDEFTASDVRDFLSYQRKREGRFGKLADSTIHKYFSVVRTFSRWIRSQDYVSNSATEKVNAPRVEEKLPECLSDEELANLFRYLKAFCSKRVQLIFSFFIDTGARLSEVMNLDIDDLFLKDGWVKVYGKGRRERILPLGKMVRKDLKEYIELIRPQIAQENEEALFVTQNGSRYSHEGLATLVKTKLKKIGIKGHYGPHKLRHTFATNYLRNGGNLEELRRVMGHRDISTTQRYLSLVPEDLFKAQQSASPNDKILERL